MGRVKSYQIGQPELDEQIRQLVIEAGDGGNQDLIAELLTTVIKLHRDKAERGDLKMVNTALKEMRYSMAVFARHHEPKVTIFGSARLAESDPNFQLAERFAALMAEKGWGVITGAGPGIMAAGSKGAGLEHSYGVNIRLPFEPDPVGYIAPQRNINFKYFFTRKLTFIKESHAFALFPGGFGTLDETFELMTLIQTGKSDMHPIVLIEAPGTAYWPPLLEFFSSTLVEKGLISPADMNLFEITGDANDAAALIHAFYSNFHSQRYVEGKLVLRMKEAPEGAALDQINGEFSDIVATGRIEKSEPLAAEEKDADALDQQRLVFTFDRRSYGRLRLLIDHLNTLVSTPDRVAPPAPFQEEQAERPW